MILVVVSCGDSNAPVLSEGNTSEELLRQRLRYAYWLGVSNASNACLASAKSMADPKTMMDSQWMADSLGFEIDILSK